MRDPVKKPSRRLDVREPLEKLGLLSLKKPGKKGSAGDHAGKFAKHPRPGRWM